MIPSPFRKPSVTPPAEHPRVMLRRRDFPRIRENIPLPECQREAALWQTLWEKNLSDFEEVLQSGAYHSLLCIVLQAKALKALLDGVNHPRNSQILHGNANANASFEDEGGWGRITITAREKRKEETFLVRFELGRAKENPA